MSSKQVYSQNIGYMWMSVWKDEEFEFPAGFVNWSG